MSEEIKPCHPGMDCEKVWGVRHCGKCGAEAIPGECCLWLEVNRLRSGTPAPSEKAREAVIQAAMNLGLSEPAYEDDRLSYVEVQVDPDDLKAFNAAVAALRAEGEDKR